MSGMNPVVPSSVASHWHGDPQTSTSTYVAGSVVFESSRPLHTGDYWAEHYVPEWEDSHPTFVRNGANNVLCDGRPLSITCYTIDCGFIRYSPIMSTIIRT